MRVPTRLKARLFLLVPLAVLAAGLLLRLADPQPLQEIRLRAFDLYQRLEPPPPSGLPVKIVDIDEASLQRLGQWPWPRSLLADLTQRASDAGARALVFNLVFAEPDRLTPEALLALLPAETGALVQAELIEGEIALPDQDFAAALAASPSVLGFAMTVAPNDRAAPLLRMGFAFIGESPLPYVPKLGGAVAALPALQAAAKGNGAITLLVDADGIVRRLPLLLGLKDQVYPALAVEALRVAQGGRGILVKTSGQEAAAASGGETGVEALRIVRDIIQTTPQGDLWLYDRPPDPGQRIAAWRLLEGDEAALAELDGAIALVGITASGIGDRHTTPLSASLPGVVLHAHAIEQLWSGLFLQRPAWTEGAEILAVLLVGLMVLTPFAWQRDGAVTAALLGLLAVLAGLAFAWWAFTEWRLLFDPVTPALVGLLVFAAAGFARLTVSERRRQEVRQAFGQYVTPEVVARIAEDPKAARLAGETRDLTILFCDIRGFTSLSEGLEPEVLAALINRFLTQMSEAVLARQGTIDKYIGDCLMAFWNAPLAVADHPRIACLTLLDMRRRLVALNRELADEQQGEAAACLAMGMGLNSGPCSVGNMGSDFRLAYTAIGDAVNLAARLEGMTRLYGLDCLVSGATRKAAGDLALLEIDWIQVKGRSQPETVYALLGDETLARSQAFVDLTAAQTAFLAAYRAGDWREARACLTAVQAAAGAGDIALDGVVGLFRQRLTALEAEPPSDDWRGVFVATTK
ncbi:MAG: adenylate/guanylate cyclase domain-containing protein [Rhodospirillales bacterium]